MKLTHKKAKGFTLVELLVVIAIIAVLATLAAPAIMRALQKAKITKAKGVCSSFETAVINFENEYNYLPYGGGGSAPTTDEEVRSDDDVVGVLAGVEDELNFKQIRFFEQGEPKGSSESSYKDGMKVNRNGGTAKLYDPWGERYYIIIDYDLDGEIDNPLQSSKVISGKKCVVYSTGPDKEKEANNAAGKNQDNPTNF